MSHINHASSASGHPSKHDPSYTALQIADQKSKAKMKDQPKESNDATSKWEIGRMTPVTMFASYVAGMSIVWVH